MNIRCEEPKYRTLGGTKPSLSVYEKRIVLSFSSTISSLCAFFSCMYRRYSAFKKDKQAEVECLAVVSTSILVSCFADNLDINPSFFCRYLQNSFGPNIFSCHRNVFIHCAPTFCDLLRDPLANLLKQSTSPSVSFNNELDMYQAKIEKLTLRIVMRSLRFSIGSFE